MSSLLALSWLCISLFLTISQIWLSCFRVRSQLLRLRWSLRQWRGYVESNGCRDTLRSLILDWAIKFICVIYITLLMVAILCGAFLFSINILEGFAVSPFTQRFFQSQGTDLPQAYPHRSWGSTLVMVRLQAVEGLLEVLISIKSDPNCTVGGHIFWRGFLDNAKILLLNIANSHLSNMGRDTYQIAALIWLLW